MAERGCESRALLIRAFVRRVPVASFRAVFESLKKPFSRPVAASDIKDRAGMIFRTLDRSIRNLLDTEFIREVMEESTRERGETDGG